MKLWQQVRRRVFSGWRRPKPIPEIQEWGLDAVEAYRRAAFNMTPEEVEAWRAGQR